MARYLTNFRLQSFLKFTLITMLAVACRPANEESPECQADSECTANTSKCLDNVCVECTIAADCECYEICAPDNTCQALGATSDSEATNAHGNWSTVPTSPDYSFVDYCEADADCSLGELCNGATGGCVLAANYPESCASDNDCPRGPLGETLSCDQERSLCLPAAKCVDDQQCCGRANVVCSQTQGLCLPLQDDCTPTPAEDLESTCPLIPRSTAECAEGLFCSNDGQCVQCQCDEDCGSPALKCRIYDGTCVSNSYCEQTSDCESGEVCKTDVNECVDSCDPSDAGSCPPQSFCDPETLYCRNNSERPCVDDSLAPNHTLQDAASLTLSFDDDYVSEFSLCSGQPDYFALEVTASSELQVFVSADERLEVLYELLGADNQTVIATGFVGELGAELLTTTISAPATRYLRVSPLNETEGFYTLNISITAADVCEALGDSPTNDTPSTATDLWSGIETEGCVEQTSNGQTSFSCPANNLNLCPGDIDYYRWDIPANSQGRLTVSSSSESLEVIVYGPTTDSDLLGPILEPTQNELGLKSYEFASRNPETFLIALSDPTSREALYTLSGELNSAGACEEDPFDAEAAASSGDGFGVQDEDGQNDESPTTLLLAPGLSTISTNVCVNDVDSFSLRSLTSPDAFPRGQVLRVDWSTEPKPHITLDSVPQSLPLALITQETAPIEIKLINPTYNSQYLGDMLVEWEEPQACNTPAHSTPSGAIIPEVDADNLNGTLTEAEPWCGFEDRWFLFEVPAEKNLEITTSSQNQLLGIEFHDESIRSVDTPTFDLPLGVSRLYSAPATLAQPQIGFLSAESQTRIIYVRVSNKSGMTDASFTVNWRIFEDLCTPDSNEDDDRIADASQLSWVEGGLSSSGVLSACPGDDDWFELSIGDSSELNAQLLTPTASNLTFELYDDSLNRLVWEEASNEPGSQRLIFNPQEMGGGPYFARVRSLTPLSAYRIDFQANGVCVDDAFESELPVELLPDTALSGLKLCNDNDVFTITDLSSEVWNICVEFTHSEIDIDIRLERAAGEFIASSATKEDVESISFNPAEDETYNLVVFADPRSAGTGTYSIVLQTAPCASQP